MYQRRGLARLLRWTLRISHRLTGHPRRPEDNVVSLFASNVSHVRLTTRDLLSALAYSVANWALDCGCLMFAYLAVPARACPGVGLLLAYEPDSWPQTSR